MDDRNPHRANHHFMGVMNAPAQGAKQIRSQGGSMMSETRQSLPTPSDWVLVGVSSLTVLRYCARALRQPVTGPLFQPPLNVIRFRCGPRLINLQKGNGVKGTQSTYTFASPFPLFLDRASRASSIIIAYSSPSSFFALSISQCSFLHWYVYSVYFKRSSHRFAVVAHISTTANHS